MGQGTEKNWIPVMTIIPPNKSAKGQLVEDIPADTLHKSMKPLGAFGIHTVKEISDIVTGPHQNKDSQDIITPPQTHKTDSPVVVGYDGINKIDQRVTVSPTSHLKQDVKIAQTTPTKKTETVFSFPKPVKKVDAPVATDQDYARKIDVSLNADQPKTTKVDSEITEPNINVRKVEQAIKEMGHKQKQEIAIGFAQPSAKKSETIAFSEQKAQKKTDDNIDVAPDTEKKTETKIDTNQKQLSKEEDPIDMALKELKKSEIGISTIVPPEKKTETVVFTSRPYEYKTEVIETITPDQEKKEEDVIQTSVASSKFTSLNTPIYENKTETTISTSVAGTKGTTASFDLDSPPYTYKEEFGLYTYGQVGSYLPQGGIISITSDTMKKTEETIVPPQDTSVKLATNILLTDSGITTPFTISSMGYLNRNLRSPLAADAQSENMEKDEQTLTILSTGQEGSLSDGTLFNGSGKLSSGAPFSTQGSILSIDQENTLYAQTNPSSTATAVQTFIEAPIVIQTSAPQPSNILQRTNVDFKYDLTIPTSSLKISDSTRFPNVSPGASFNDITHYVPGLRPVFQLSSSGTYDVRVTRLSGSDAETLRQQNTASWTGPQNTIKDQLGFTTTSLPTSLITADDTGTFSRNQRDSDVISSTTPLYSHDMLKPADDKRTDIGAELPTATNKPLVDKDIFETLLATDSNVVENPSFITTGMPTVAPRAQNFINTSVQGVIDKPSNWMDSDLLDAIQFSSNYTDGTVNRVLSSLKMDFANILTGNSAASAELVSIAQNVFAYAGAEQFTQRNIQRQAEEVTLIRMAYSDVYQSTMISGVAVSTDANQIGSLAVTPEAKAFAASVSGVQSKISAVLTGNLSSFFGNNNDQMLRGAITGKIGSTIIDSAAHIYNTGIPSTAGIWGWVQDLFNILSPNGAAKINPTNFATSDAQKSAQRLNEMAIQLGYPTEYGKFISTNNPFAGQRQKDYWDVNKPRGLGQSNTDNSIKANAQANQSASDWRTQNFVLDNRPSPSSAEKIFKVSDITSPNWLTSNANDSYAYLLLAEQDTTSTIFPQAAIPPSPSNTDSSYTSITTQFTTDWMWNVYNFARPSGVDNDNWKDPHLAFLINEAVVRSSLKNSLLDQLISDGSVQDVYTLADLPAGTHDQQKVLLMARNEFVTNGGSVLVDGGAVNGGVRPSIQSSYNTAFDPAGRKSVPYIGTYGEKLTKSYPALLRNDFALNNNSVMLDGRWMNSASNLSFFPPAGSIDFSTAFSYLHTGNADRTAVEVDSFTSKLYDSRDDFYKTIYVNHSSKHRIDDTEGTETGTKDHFTGAGYIAVLSNWLTDAGGKESTDPSQWGSAAGKVLFKIPFQFDPEISGEDRSANWTAQQAMGRTSDWFIWANTGSRSLNIKMSLVIADYRKGEGPFDREGNMVTDGSIATNPAYQWLKGWDEQYVLNLLNRYRALVLPMSVLDQGASYVPPLLAIVRGYWEITPTSDSFRYARWIVDSYSVEPNLQAGYTKNRNPIMYDVNLQLKEIYNTWNTYSDLVLASSMDIGSWLPKQVGYNQATPEVHVASAPASRKVQPLESSSSLG
jgi:hypothetical protein